VSRRRTLVVCPGRGSYERGSLGSLQHRSAAASAVIEACDVHRAAEGRATVTALDAAPAYKSSLHVAGEHASLLTFACSLADLADLDRSRYEVVGVCGNSMGWYTALAAAGALALQDAVRLVDTMGSYQEGNVVGGQVLYPVSDEQWVPSPALLGGVEATLAAILAAGAWAGWSIRLGGFAVLAGDADGVKQLLAKLPPVQRGDRTFPLQLPLHSAFHTPLLQDTSERARGELADLSFRAPEVDLVDGRGRIFRPGSADPAELHEYTLGHQVLEPYDFTTSVITALHRTGADTVVALGPGNPLGGPLARILVEARWRNARTKSDFERINQQEPLLRSFGMPAQRRELEA
jgi:[acyl-carrier-protein] S-malonyltransferase